MPHQAQMLDQVAASDTTVELGPTSMAGSCAGSRAAGCAAGVDRLVPGGRPSSRRGLAGADRLLWVWKAYGDGLLERMGTPSIGLVASRRRAVSAAACLSPRK